MGSGATTAGRRVLGRGAVVALVGVAVLGVVGAALAALYINQVADSAAALKHTEALPDYVGRPLAATASDGTSAMNLLVTVTDGGGLEAIVLANLSADRRSLTLITAPPALSVGDGDDRTLASIFATDPAMTARVVEGLTGSRVDHLIQVDLAGVSTVVDAVGGVQLDGRRMDGTSAVAAVRAAGDPSTVGAELLRATMVAAQQRSGLAALSVPVGLIQAASNCTEIDSGLTSQVIEATLMESSVRPAEIRLWPLATFDQDGVVVADPSALDALGIALAEPNLTSTAEYAADAFLPR